MNTTAEIFLALCWLTFFVYWIVAALFTKRTAHRSAHWAGWCLSLLLAASVVLRRSGVPSGGNAVLWHTTPALAAVADAVTCTGLVIALWARTVLGRNWSAFVVFKERHELIERGPYRVVRHPIYTGVLLMLLGTATLWGRLAGLILIGGAFAGLSLKAWHEERLLTKHFPAAYVTYRARVRAALIPFVL